MARLLFPPRDGVNTPPPAPVNTIAPTSPAKPADDGLDAAARRAESRRKSMLAKIHIGKEHCIKTLSGYTEDMYRYTLEDMFGVQSARDLTAAQMHDLLLHLGSLGWVKRPRKHTGRAPNAYHKDSSGLSREGLLSKIEAMLAEKGSAEGTDVPWGYAVGILKRQSKGVTKSLDQATREQLTDIIAALYRDAKRRGRRVR